MRDKGGTSKINEFKMEVTKAAPPRTFEFLPLRSWPVSAHPRQSDLDAYRVVKSLVK